jgi:hypothetical protein
MTFINLKKSIAFYREYAIIDLSNEREVNRMSIEKLLLNKRCNEIRRKYEDEIVDIETIYTLEQEEAVCYIECLGASGNKVGMKWYSCVLEDGTDFDFYCRIDR